MNFSHDPSSYSYHNTAPQPSHSPYIGGTCLDHKSYAYQPDPRALSLNAAERSAIFKAAFARHPNGLDTEEEYRRLAVKLNITVPGVKTRFRKAQKRLQQGQ
ncbi:unnamed protein product [Peniophora sp. CBMAI 1063]|nr:unnamed protein product [Peniophora sp. CBMAI 1063]